MNYDILCFCHLRWNFVYQRPQHLMSRFAMDHRVFFIEEAVFGEGAERLEINKNADSNTWIIVPHLPEGIDREETIALQTSLLDSLLASMKIKQFILWYYSPVALQWSDHLHPVLRVYDCMDELSAFKFAPPELISLERQLLIKSDVVFTGGHSLYEAKKHLHNNIYPFPSSIDKSHFMIARANIQEPDDQEQIPHPRLGFYGVLDERFDWDLLDKISSLQPAWHFILVGPFAKVDPSTLPQKNNIHYLGMKEYKDLPSYLGGWDIAIMPFALNASTKFISPTKTPEYLAGGKPVISTPIDDVVTPYGSEGLVHIVSTPEEFIAAGETILNTDRHDEWLGRVDTFLSGISWDRTWQGMDSLINLSIKSKPIIHAKDMKHV